MLDAVFLELELAQEELRVMHEEVTEQSQEVSRHSDAVDRERTLLRAVFGELPVPVFVLDDGGFIRRANGAAAELLGTSTAYMAGKPFPVFVDLAARPPSESAMPIGKVAVTLLVFRSTRDTVWSPQFGTHRLSKATAKPEQGALPTVTVSATLFVFGSMRTTLFFGLLEIQTASPTAIQSGEPGTSNTASGFKTVMGSFIPGVFTPVLAGFSCP